MRLCAGEHYPIGSVGADRVALDPRPCHFAGDVNPVLAIVRDRIAAGRRTDDVVTRGGQTDPALITADVVVHHNIVLGRVDRDPVAGLAVENLVLERGPRVAMVVADVPAPRSMPPSVLPRSSVPTYPVPM